MLGVCVPDTEPDWEPGTPSSTDVALRNHLATPLRKPAKMLPSGRGWSDEEIAGAARYHPRKSVRSGYLCCPRYLRLASRAVRGAPTCSVTYLLNRVFPFLDPAQPSPTLPHPSPIEVPAKSDVDGILLTKLGLRRQVISTINQAEERSVQHGTILSVRYRGTMTCKRCCLTAPRRGQLSYVKVAPSPSTPVPRLFVAPGFSTDWGGADVDCEITFVGDDGTAQHAGAQARRDTGHGPFFPFWLPTVLPRRHKFSPFPVSSDLLSHPYRIRHSLVDVL